MKSLFARTCRVGLRVIGLAILIYCAQIVCYPQATDSQAGNVLYKAPKDWKRLEQNGAVVFLPNVPADKVDCFLTIFLGQDLSGDFRAWFDNTVKKAIAGSRTLSGGEVTATKADEGYPVLYTKLATENSGGQRAYRFYLAANPGARVELIAYIATSQEAYQRYQPVLDAFIKSMDFANLQTKSPAPNQQAGKPSSPAAQPAPARPAATQAGGLEGLYTGTTSRQQYNMLTHYYDYIVNTIYYLFLPDGRVYYGLPKGGSLSHFDFARAQREDAKNCGYYKISGNQIQFEWPGVSNSKPMAFQRQQDRLQIGGTTYHRVGRFDGLRLSGTYSVRSFTNTSAGAQTSGVSGERRIDFGRDGHFSQQGFVGFTGSTPNVGGYTRSQSSGSGTYRISDNTLELTYAEGSRQQFTFFVHPENAREAQPGLIVIDGTNYLLRK